MSIVLNELKRLFPGRKIMVNKKDWQGYSIFKKISIVAGAFMGLVAVATVLTKAYGHFTTDAEALAAHIVLAGELEVYKVSETVKFKNDRLDRITRELKRIRLELANPNIELWKEKQLLLDKTDWEKTELCIQNDTC